MSWKSPFRMKATFDDIPPSLQDLLPKWAHFCLYVERFISRELGVTLEGKRLVVGVSGGVDSTALLLALHYLSSRNNFKITTVHLNHGLRDSAAHDAAWVEQLSSHLKVPCIVKSENVSRLAQENSIGIEEAGRLARYTLFENVRTSEGAHYVALGHHLDDLSEDVLMRLIRGTGWPGLSGMTGYDPKRQIIRPFLTLPKSTLIAFVKYLTISWCEDETNQDTSWTRNRVRNDLMPLVLNENPNFRESVARLWKIGQIEQDYWTVKTSEADQELSNDLLKDSHLALRLRLYKRSLDDLGPGQALAHTLFKLDEAWMEKKTGAIFQFPGEKTATITHSGVLFSTKH